MVRSTKDDTSTRRSSEIGQTNTPNGSVLSVCVSVFFLPHFLVGCHFSHLSRISCTSPGSVCHPWIRDARAHTHSTMPRPVTANFTCQSFVHHFPAFPGPVCRLFDIWLNQFNLRTTKKRASPQSRSSTASARRCSINFCGAVTRIQRSYGNREHRGEGLENVLSKSKATALWEVCKLLVMYRNT